MHKSAAALTASLAGVTVVVASLAMVRMANEPATARAVSPSDPTFKPGPMPQPLTDVTVELAELADRYGQLLTDFSTSQAQWRRSRQQLADSLDHLRRSVGSRIQSTNKDTVAQKLLIDQLALLDVNDLEANRLSWLGRLQRALGLMDLEEMDSLLAEMRDQASRSLSDSHRAASNTMNLRRCQSAMIRSAEKLTQIADDLVDQAASEDEHQKLVERIAYSRWAQSVLDRCEQLAVESAGPVAADRIEQIRGQHQKLIVLVSTFDSPAL